MKLDRAIKLQKQYVSRFRDLYSMAESCCMHADKIQERTLEIISEDAYKRMPTHAKEYVRGARDLLYDMHWRKVKYAYIIDGVTMTTDSDEYRSIPAFDVHQKYSHTGHHVYSHNPSRRFTDPRP